MKDDCVDVHCKKCKELIACVIPGVEAYCRTCNRFTRAVPAIEPVKPPAKKRSKRS